MKETRAIIEAWRIIEHYNGAYEIAGKIIGDRKKEFKDNELIAVGNIEKLDLLNKKIETTDSIYFLGKHLYSTVKAF